MSGKQKNVDKCYKFEINYLNSFENSEIQRNGSSKNSAQFKHTVMF